jgi:hypothetical protein
MLKRRDKVMLDYYEETLKELEDITLNLDNISRNELYEQLSVIINRGWLQIETMSGKRKKKQYTKEEIQEHFNSMLRVVPITRIKKEK